jgi:hypothetical protein
LRSLKILPEFWEFFCFFGWSSFQMVLAVWCWIVLCTYSIIKIHFRLILLSRKISNVQVVILPLQRMIKFVLISGNESLNKQDRNTGQSLITIELTWRFEYSDPPNTEPWSVFGLDLMPVPDHLKSRQIVRFSDGWD